MKKISLILVLFVFLSLTSCVKNDLVISEIQDNSQDNLNHNDASADASFSDAFKEEESIGFVHICGAVKNPGIYKVSSGERLYEVIERSGGFDEEADTEAVNLAQE